MYGGPDDTLLTIWRHLRGTQTGIVFQIAGKLPFLLPHLKIR